MAAFLPVLDNGWVDWDDPGHFLNNPHYRGLGWENLRWMFTSFHQGLYLPVAWLALGFQYLVWGMEAGGYHLTSLLLHGLNAFLLYRLALRLLPRCGGLAPAALPWAAAASSLAFALHPLRVQAVAWASDQRGVLAGAFLLLSLLAYLRAVESAKRRRWLALSWAAYVLAVLSKAVVMGFPLVLLVLDAYPLRRRAWLEKLPFLAAALAGGAAAYAAVHSAGILLGLSEHGVAQRGAQAAFGLAFYLWKTLWPFGLIPVYETPSPFDPWAAPFVCSGLGVAALAAVLWSLRRASPGAAAAFACYVFGLGPVLGAVKTGVFLSADNYSYLPSIPLALAGGWAVGRAAQAGRTRVLAAAAAVLASWGGLTWRQSRVWRDTGALWRHTLSVKPDHAVAHDSLGVLASKEGRLNEAVTHCRMAVRVNPRMALAWVNLGSALVLSGQDGEAVLAYEQALRINPRLAEAHNRLGRVLTGQGRASDAERHYRSALEADPVYVEARYNLAVLLTRSGRMPEARSEYEEVLRREPGHAEAANNLGLLLDAAGRSDAARGYYRLALRSLPTRAMAHYNWGNSLWVERRLTGAERHYRLALAVDPLLDPARFNLANTLLRLGRAGEAASQYRRYLERNPGDRQAFENLQRAVGLRR